MRNALVSFINMFNRIRGDSQVMIILSLVWFLVFILIAILKGVLIAFVTTVLLWTVIGVLGFSIHEFFK